MKKTVRKIFSGVLSVTVLVSGLMCVQPALAESEVLTEGDFQYTVSGKKATIIKCVSKDEVLVIPETINEFKVAKLGHRAFANSKFKEIQIPESVEAISSSAFQNADNLEKIVLPSKLKSLGESAFRGCDALNEVTFNGNNLTKIGWSVFYNCGELEKITLPNSVTRIDWRAFGNCVSLKEIELTKNLEQISSYAFSGCANLKSITIPSRVKSVGNGAFEECSDLKTVKFEGADTRLRENVFDYCESLENVKLPKNMKNIPVGTFENCESLKNIKIPEKVAIIKKDAFAGCSSLKTLKLNKKIYAIGDRAFDGSGLRKIKINQKLQFVGNAAFRDTKLKNANLGNKIKFIGSKVFYGCSKLKKIYIPASVKGINMGAFNGCDSLQEINVSSANANYSSLNGVLYNKDKSVLLQYPINKKSTSFVSPVGVYKVRNSAFSGNKHLKSATINAKIIGKYAFTDMSNLSSVTLNGTQTIKRSAFAGNGKLARVSLPSTVVTIDSWAFSNTSITTFNLPYSLRSLSGSALNACTKLKTITGTRSPAYAVKDGVLYNSSYTTLIKYPSKKSDKTFTVPDSVQNVRSNAFDKVNKLKNLYFGTGLKRLPYGSVSGAKRLKTVVFYGKSMSYVSSYAVNGCPNLAVVVGPNKWSLKNLASNLNATFITA